MILVVKTGTAHTVVDVRLGDFDGWIAQGLGAPVEVCRVDGGEVLPEPGVPAGVVVTGSPAMVTDRAPWSERTGEWLAAAVEAGTPVLGICFGHQLLAHALGGRVGPNPRGREIGTVTVRLHPGCADDELLGALPGEIRVHATHLESVLELPAGVPVLASSELDPYHVFRVPGRRAWGVQFHPEFTAGVTRAYVERKREMLAAEGADADALLSGVEETPWGGVILRRFAALAVG